MVPVCFTSPLSSIMARVPLTVATGSLLLRQTSSIWTGSALSCFNSRVSVSVAGSSSVSYICWATAVRFNSSRISV